MAQELKTKSTPENQHNSSNLAHHSALFRERFETIREQFKSDSRQLALWLTPLLNPAHFNKSAFHILPKVWVSFASFLAIDSVICPVRNRHFQLPLVVAGIFILPSSPNPKISCKGIITK